MKKLIKLKGEVIVIFIISIIIGWSISALAINTYYRSGYGQRFVEKMAIKRNEEDIDYIKRVLDIESGNEDFVKMQIVNKDSIPNTSSDYTIYLTDIKGNVLASTSDLKIEKITIENENSFRIEKNQSKFTGKTFIKLNDNRYVVLINEGYCKDDIYATLVCIIIIIIVFLFLLKGRVDYINTIASKVREIAKGDLSKRVVIKYSNELTDLAKDINYMADEIQNQDNKQREFITNISHDLRTPLTTIMGYLKMIEEEKYSDNKELQKYVGIATKKGKYLKKLLDDFFNYSKLSSNDVKIEMVQINIKDCVKEIILEEEIKFIEKNLNINSSISNKKLITIGDPMLIGRVFENLMENAVKYSKENTEVNLELKEAVVNNKNHAVFSISNVPKEEISEKESNRLFDRLYKKSSARTEGGSGLGLAISKEIVNKHNGFISVSKMDSKILFTVGFQIK